MSGSKDRDCEPSPRFWHSAQILGEKLYIRGGCTQRYDDEEERDELLKTIEEFDANDRKWRKVVTKGDHHPGLTDVACTSFGNYLYAYGGNNSKGLNAVLSQLDVETFTWTKLSQESKKGPMTKDASGMVHFGDDSLAVVCGYADPRDSSKNNGGSSDETSQFIPREGSAPDGGGWTNEMHVFNVKYGNIILAQSKLNLSVWHK